MSPLSHQNSAHHPPVILLSPGWRGDEFVEEHNPLALLRQDGHPDDLIVQDAVIPLDPDNRGFRFRIISDPGIVFQDWEAILTEEGAIPDLDRVYASKEKMDGR
jgi:hypothetical protein